MGALSKLLVVFLFGGMGVAAYTGSVMGWGLGGLRNQKTASVIEENCPDYRRQPNGDCLARTYRSYYLVRGIRGGGFGGGK